jgi:hypothetical protein
MPAFAGMTNRMLVVFGFWQRKIAQIEASASHSTEIPAQAGTQYSADSIVYWIPAFAGISDRWRFNITSPYFFSLHTTDSGNWQGSPALVKAMRS